MHLNVDALQMLKLRWDLVIAHPPCTYLTVTGNRWFDEGKYGDTRYAADEYDEEFDFLGWHFHFWGDDTGGTPRYGATMSRDGETWECDYDCMFGAGFDDIH